MTVNQVNKQKATCERELSARLQGFFLLDSPHLNLY